MEPAIQARFTAEVQAAVAAAVGVDSEQVGKNLGFESFVHQVERDGQAVFVKSTWSGRRTQAQVQAEVDFVRHLADGGAPVTRPVRLADGADVVSVPAPDGAFLVSACEQAKGSRLAAGDVTEAHLAAWGRMAGTMHRLAADPKCAAWMSDRPAWEREYEDLLPFAKDERVRQRYESLLARLRELPSDAAVYGLNHTDLHDANVHWEGLAPTAFDFEDCMGFWYASDLAIVLYYTLNRHVEQSQRQAAYVRFRSALREGYEVEHTLPEAAWETLPLFLDFRETLLWLVCERSVPHERRGEAFVKWMDGMHARIVGGIHPFDLRFDD